MNHEAAHRASAAAPPLEAIDACHREVLHKLSELNELAARLRTAELDEAWRAKAQAVHDFFATVARQHHLDEERHVFPMLLSGDDLALAQTVMTLQQDHGWLEEDWLELSPQLEAIARGYNWYDPETFDHAAQVFGDLYRDHILLEESLVYPQVRRRIEAGQWQGGGREAAQRRRASSEAPKP